jgi:FkbM family methyltransferase
LLSRIGRVASKPRAEIRHRLCRKRHRIAILEPRPAGVDLFADIAYHLPRYAPALVLDVGANTGQSAVSFRRNWPGARIHCFEPGARAFARLKRIHGRDARVECHPYALGAREGSCLVSGEGVAATTTHGTGCVSAAMTTVDAFCRRNGIGAVSFLKIDTEGADLDVLHGASRQLNAQAVDFVQVEAGVNPANRWHVPIRRFLDFFEEKGYAPFGIYEQRHEWPTRSIELRRVDLVVVSGDLVSRREALRGY